MRGRFRSLSLDLRRAERFTSIRFCKAFSWIQETQEPVICNAELIYISGQ